MLIAQGDSGWERLLAAWKAEGRPSYVVIGGAHYRVLTPDGEESPKFQPMSDSSLYGQVSTGLPQAGSPPARGGKRGK